MLAMPFYETSLFAGTTITLAAILEFSSQDDLNRLLVCSLVAKMNGS